MNCHVPGVTALRNACGGPLLSRRKGIACQRAVCAASSGFSGEAALQRGRRRRIDMQIPPQQPPRVFAVSDVHTDHEANLDWIRSISRTNFRNDAIIVAGDATDSLAVLRQTLTLFLERFGTVFFCPGNHELWVGRKNDPGGCADSVEKLRAVFALCRELGVLTEPHRVGGRVWVVPLQSWYHASFDTEPDLTVLDVPNPSRVMTDFAACKWPQGLNPLDDSVARFFDELNDAPLAAFRAAREQSPGPVISFSHFLPRIELCPEKRFLFYPKLPKAVGSDFLRRRVEALKPDMHVFGHTHFAWDQDIGGVRYVQAALAYPSERQQRMVTLAIGNLATEPVLLFDCGAEDGFQPRMSCRWSDYYSAHERDPTNQTLPPWLAGRWAHRLKRQDEAVSPPAAGRPGKG